MIFRVYLSYVYVYISYIWNRSNSEQWLLVLRKCIFNWISYTCVYLLVVILPSYSCEHLTENLFLLFVCCTSHTSILHRHLGSGHHGDTTAANTMFEFFVSFEGKAGHQDKWVRM